MGGSSSKSTQKTVEDDINSDYNSCGTTTSYNVTTLTGIQFDPPADCNPPSSMTIGQTATVDATCLLSALQTSAANTANTLDSSSQAGLGVSKSSGSTYTTTDIENYTTNACANVSATNMASVDDTVIQSCQFQVVQNANANQSCQINATQSLLNTISNSTTSSATGGSIFGDLFGGGSLGAIVGIIIVIAIIVAVIYFVKKGSSSSKGGSTSNISALEMAELVGGASGCKYSYYVLLLFLLILLVLMITDVYKCMNKKNVPTIIPVYQPVPVQFNAQPNAYSQNYHNNLNDYYQTLV